ncbi:STAS domain-containing protein [Polyangium spumosum]|uniref:STAS domain-containing protein n=1 Tax=Polyangium spumosum TaxID=889282 RepID=A0A6N7Q0L6_9BACT|nr:STAS domain-containing protein [Polyangium spumosum]MRG96280.1 STAS domain-containing protein [Polyangium spumosum]
MGAENRRSSGEHPLAAFHDALLAQQDTLVDRTIERARPHLPWLADMPREALMGSVGEDVLAYARALLTTDFDDLRARARSWCENQITVGNGAAFVLASVEAIRKDYLEVALDALAQGVPGVREGVLRLMDAFAAVVAEIDGFFHGAPAQEAVGDRLFRMFVDASPDPVALSAGSEAVLYANAAFKETFGGEGIPSKPLVSFLADGAGEALARLSDVVDREGRGRGELHLRRADGGVYVADVTAFDARATGDRASARFLLLRDKGPLVAAEETRMRLQEEIIASQAEAIRALSTPLLPIAEGVIVMPLVGALNEARAEQMLEALLEGISRRGARVAILDITGVDDVDSHVAHGILRAARAAALLGARVFLTGIRGSVAQTLLALDASFGGLVTCSTLQDGVTRALRGARVEGYAPRRWTG